MNALTGVWIRQERLKRNYSQEGLCKGICVVSYLSKIEQGKAEAGSDIIKALLKRLELDYETDASFLQRAGETIDTLYEELYEGIFPAESMKAIEAEKSRYLCSDYMLDALLFSNLSADIRQEISRDYIPCMKERQYQLYLYLECRAGKEDFERLLSRSPNGFYLTQAGYYAWRNGNYNKSIELLNRAYPVCCEEGTVHNMLLAKIILGNCCASMQNAESMLRHYRTAKRIAAAMSGQEEQIETIDYNTASSFLEWGEITEAVRYLSRCKKKDALYYHKYAICMEQLGNRKMALDAVLKGRKEISSIVKREYGSGDQTHERLFHHMFDLVEYRLNHPDYIRDFTYEQLLRNCMEEMKELLPRGFEAFHSLYLKELLEFQRKYKELYQLTKEFSS